MRCRCAETDAEVQRCLSGLGAVQRQSVDVVPDAPTCRRRSSDAFVVPQKLESDEEVSVSRLHTAKSAENVNATTSQSFPSQQEMTGFDVRDYLIDRCVTDTTVTAGNDDNYDDTSGDDRTVSSQDSCELRSNKPPPTVLSHRFSDSELVRRGYAATLPGRGTSVPGGDSRAKRHRWKLLRKALNFFSSDDSIAAAAGADDGSLRTGGVAGSADDDDDQIDGGTGQSGEELLQRLGVHSVSVESLPGSVATPHHISHRRHHHLILCC